MVAPPDRPVALSIGDPAGIGPELAVLLWHTAKTKSLPPFLVMHGAQVLEAAAGRIGLPTPVMTIADSGEAAGCFSAGLPVLGSEDAIYAPGRPDDGGARLALASLKDAVTAAHDGTASAVVTLPVAKARLASIGFAHPGQTEFLAAACDLPDDASVMMLAGPSLKAVPLTVHCALAEVPQLLSVGLIHQRGHIVANALKRDYGVASPRLAITGLNPHAGEGGLLGQEEIEIISPLLDDLRTNGMDLAGPLSADTMFHAPARVNVLL